MKKVLYVHCVESHIINFHLPYLKCFMRHNYSVHVATSGSAQIDNCECHFTVHFSQSPFALSNFKALFELRKILKDNEYEFIILNGAIGGMIGRIASSRIAKTTKIVYIVHGFPFFEGAPFMYNCIYKFIEKVLLRLTDILIVTNLDDCDAFKKFKTNKNIEFYYMPGVGIDSKKFLCESLDREIFKERTNIEIKNTDFVMITAGEFTKRKNHKLLFDAMRILNDSNIKLLVCGEGNLYNDYVSYIDENNIKNIFFLGYREDLAQLVANADLFVFPSIREGLPISIQVAMLNRTAVLASNIRGHNDLIINKENGLLFNNIDELVEDIKFLRNHPTVIKQYCDKSIVKIEDFDISKTMKIFESIFFEREKVDG